MAHRANPVTNETSYRVYHVAESLRDACKAARAEAGLSIREYIESTVASRLPGLVQQLRDLGFAAMEKRRPARWPMGDATLSSLKGASEELGIPASDLLMICLRQASQTAAKPRAKRGRKAK
jgi:hypothetical protein